MYLGWKSNSNLQANLIANDQETEMRPQQEICIPDLHSELGKVFKIENKITFTIITFYLIKITFKHYFFFSFKLLISY